MSAKTFDPRCADLARVFLEDAQRLTPDTLEDLARDIQRTIEDFFVGLDLDDERRRRDLDA